MFSDTTEINGLLLKIAAVMGLIMLGVAYTTLLERKLIAFMQLRIGPRRVGWRGILQPVADGLKLMTKECIIPAAADKRLFIMAPIISLAFALAAFAVVPFSPGFYLADVNIGILYILAMSSMGFYGMMMAGWASGNKYSHLGAMRAIAQMISYEVPMVISVLGVFVLARSLSLREIVDAQREANWFIFQQPMAFIIYLISGIAETARIPFDLPEGEGELVAGFHTEYSGIRFAMFFLAEYANMFIVSLIAALAFLGGWLRPLPNVTALAFLDVIPPIFWLLAKVFFFIFLYVWLRATLLRPQYNRLMFICWKVLVPLAFFNIVLTSLFALWNVKLSINLTLGQNPFLNYTGNILVYSGLFGVNILLAGLWLMVCTRKTQL